MEAPPFKGVIFAVAFLGLFGILVGSMPSGFYEGSTPQSFRPYNYPEYFEGIEVAEFATTFLMNISSGTYTNQWGVEEGYGHDFYFFGSSIYYHMYNYHTFPFWIFYLNNEHKMDWLNGTGYSRGDILNSAEIASDFVNETSEYTVQCKDLHMKAWVGWNTTEYGQDEAGLKDAWDDGELKILWAIDMDQLGSTTGMTAWNIVSMLLLFQLPNVHPVINIIIATPIWALIAVLVFQFIIAVIKALPFT